MKAGIIDILTGVARSGKTARLLAEYRTALAEGFRCVAPSGTLWISPTNRARHCVRDALMDGSLSACLAPNVFTFDDFAEQVLVSSAQGIRQLTGVAQRALVRRLLDECLAAGELPYFAPIAETTGFLDLVIAFIAELKRDEVWPEQFLTACRARGLDARDRELARLYERYQSHLHQQKLYDATGRFWSARTLLRDGGGPAFQRFSLVVVDGFTDFTHTQYKILAELARRSERLMISLPLDSSPQRYDLFAKSRRALERLEQMSDFGHPVKIHACRRSEPTQLPAADHMADRLFGNPRTTERLSQASDVHISAATAQLGEVRMLARQVKAMLQSGVSAGQIVVAFRSLRDYAGLVEEVFGAAGIPFWCEAGHSLAQAPLVKAVRSLLWLEAEDWPFDRLMSVLDSNYFRPAWGSRQNGAGPRHVGAALRGLGIDSGRETALDALRRRVSHDSGPGEGSGTHRPDDSEVAAAASALALLEDLASATARLAGPAPFAAWVDRMSGLVRELGMIPPAADERAGEDDPFRQRDRLHWDQLQKTLCDACEAEETFDSEPPELPLETFLTRFSDLIGTSRISPGSSDEGRVLVLEATQVRNIDVDSLFLAGLDESSFPSTRGEDCLYGEMDLRRLNEHGLQMGLRSTHQQDELLMFYMIVTRPRRRLMLSYPAVSTSGQPLYPSPYLKAIEDLFAPGSIETHAETELDPVPQRDALLSVRDLRLAATAELGQNQPGLFRALRDHLPTSAAASSVLNAVDTAVARFHTRGFTPFEGLVRAPEHLRRLRELYPADYEFSATQLENYANCPFRFFVTHVLKLEPTEAPLAATDHRFRGSLVHDVLASIHRQWTGMEAGAAGPSKKTLVDRFRQRVDDRLGRHVATSQLQAALFRIEREMLHEWAEAYGSQWEAYQSAFSEQWDDRPHPRLIEARFGNVPEAADDAGTDVLPAIVLGSGAQQTRVCGRIDRIDVGRVQQQTVFNLIDYKTGHAPRFSLDDVESGRALQLALYTLAACRLELAGAGARPFQMGYWAVRETGFVTGIKRGRGQQPIDDAVLNALQATLDELVPRLADHIRGGDFPVFSQDPDCTGRCPLNTVCRVNQIRPLQESLEKQFDL